MALRRTSTLILAAVTGASLSASGQPLPARPPRLTVAFGQGAGDEIASGLSTPRAARAPMPARRDQTAPAEAHAAAEPVRACLSAPVEVQRVNTSGARWTGSLTDCSGRPTARAMAALALLAQPGRAGPIDLAPALESLRAQLPSTGYALSDDAPVARPSRRRARNARVAAPAVPPVQRDPDTHDPWIEVAPRARVYHPRLIQMLQQVIEHFPGHRVEIISGYRPASEGRHSESRHAHARAMDFRLEGVGREALRDFSRTLPDAGVGYYPHSVFVHLDVRDHDEGRAFWVDFSSPGERPRYGHWPPSDQDVQHEVDHLVHSVQHELDEAYALEQQRIATPPAQSPEAPAEPTPEAPVEGEQ